MSTILRTALLVASLAMSGAASAEQDLTAFTSAIQRKITFSLMTSAAPSSTSGESRSESATLVDVGTDGSVQRVANELPNGNLSASSKLQRAIFVASPFPIAPSALANEYSSLRLKVIYAVDPEGRIVINKVEVKGGFKYVAF